MPRALEFAVVFIVLPALLALSRRRPPVLPALWLIAGLCLLLLLRDPAMDRRQLWNARALPAYLLRSAPGLLPGILPLFAATALVLALAMRRFAPDLFLKLPRRNPLLWAAILVLYPVLSVYPQSIVYRAFLFHRYEAMFGGAGATVVAGALAFGFMHVVFRNPYAVALTTLAGLLFAARYVQTGSLFVSTFEHALYGCLIFTIGLGRFFYRGAVPRQTP